MSDLIAAASGDLDDLARCINREHQAAAEALTKGLAHARQAGELLLQAKKLVPHGGWLAWLKSNCTVSERTAQAYMRVARQWPELEAKAQRVADLPMRDALTIIAEPNKTKALPALSALEECRALLETAAGLQERKDWNASSAAFQLAAELANRRVAELSDGLEANDVSGLVAVRDEMDHFQRLFAEHNLRGATALGQLLLIFLPASSPSGEAAAEREKVLTFCSKARAAGRLLSEARDDAGIAGQQYADALGSRMGITVDEGDLLIRAHRERLGDTFTHKRLYRELELFSAVADVAVKVAERMAATNA